MAQKTLVYGLLLIILLILIYRVGPTERMASAERTVPGERFTMGLSDVGPEPVQVLSAVPAEAVIGSAPSVKLYEGPYGRDLAYDFTPRTTDVGEGYMRIIMPISLQSLDINLPLRDPALEPGDMPNITSRSYDPQRFVQVWAVFGDDTVASTESGFYNAYTEPDWARRANSAKYKLIAAVAPGERLVANVQIRVRRIFLICNLL